MSIVGGSVRDPNFRLRFFAIIVLGFLGAGIALSWRSQILLAAEYQEMPTTHLQVRVKKENEQKKLLMQKHLKTLQTEE